jgi:hypothetical protein
VRKILAGIDEKARARKPKSLTHQVAGMFQGKNQRPAKEIQRLVDALFEHGWVAEAEGALTYHL